MLIAPGNFDDDQEHGSHCAFALGSFEHRLALIASRLCVSRGLRNLHWGASSQASKPGYHPISMAFLLARLLVLEPDWPGGKFGSNDDPLSVEGGVGIALESPFTGDLQ